MRVWPVIAGAAVVGASLGVVLERSRPEPEMELPEALAPMPKMAAPASAEEPPPVEALKGLPPYPGARPRSLANGLTVQGVPMHVAWFSTKDTPEQVLSFYEEKLAAAGLPLVSRRYSAAAGYVGYMEIPSDRLHLISVLRQGDETLVFPSSSQVRRMMESKESLPIPSPPNVEGRLVFGFDEGGQKQRSMVATVKKGTVGEVVEFYKQGLVREGWRLSDDRVSADQVRIEATKGGASASVVIRRAAGGVSLFVTMSNA